METITETIRGLTDSLCEGYNEDECCEISGRQKIIDIVQGLEEEIQDLKSEVIK